MDTGRQPTTLTPQSGLEARYDRVGLADNPMGRIQEFLTGYSRAGATGCALEKNRVQLMLKSAQTPAQCRLPDVECLCRLAKASMLRFHDRPCEVTQFDICMEATGAHDTSPCQKARSFGWIRPMSACDKWPTNMAASDSLIDVAAIQLVDEFRMPYRFGIKINSNS